MRVSSPARSSGGKACAAPGRCRRPATPPRRGSGAGNPPARQSFAGRSQGRPPASWARSQNLPGGLPMSHPCFVKHSAVSGNASRLPRAFSVLTGAGTNRIPRLLSCRLWTLVSPLPRKDGGLHPPFSHSFSSHLTLAKRQVFPLRLEPRGHPFPWQVR